MTTFKFTGGVSRLDANGRILVTLAVGGATHTFYSKAATCHEAGYRATEIAGRLARRLGCKQVAIRTSPLVRNQMTGVWKTRVPAMVARRKACKRVMGSMKVHESPMRGGDAVHRTRQVSAG